MKRSERKGHEAGVRRRLCLRSAMLKAKKERTKENRQNVKVEELTSQVHCITLLPGLLRQWIWMAKRKSFIRKELKEVNNDIA